jgi:hypothetical protein
MVLTTRLDPRTEPALTAPLAPTLAAVQQISVDLDERAFVFPAGKPLTRLVLHASGRHIQIDAIFAFNATRTPPRLLGLELDDARLLARSLVDAVYLARSQHAISETLRVSIEVLANGYRLHFGELDQGLDLYLGTASIWRVCQALLRAVDAIAPVESH